MLKHNIRYTIRLLLSLACLAIALTASNAQALASMNKTSSTVAEDLAAQWQKASAKYDPARARILTEVKQSAHDGKFRPDWGSLSKYEVPE